MSGVTIEWDNVNSEVFKETLTGKKMPDVILRGKLGNGDLATYGDEGVIIDLRPIWRSTPPTSGSCTPPPSPAL